MAPFGIKVKKTVVTIPVGRRIVPRREEARLPQVPFGASAQLPRVIFRKVIHKRIGSLTIPPGSVALLIVTNLVPLFGVLHLGWSLFSILFLYWLETFVIAFYNTLKIAKVSKSPARDIPRVARVYLVFLLVEFLAVLSLFGGSDIEVGLDIEFSAIPLEPLRQALDTTTLVTFLGFFASHGFSYFSNFVRGQEFRGMNAGSQLTTAPFFRRILLIHVVAGFGGIILNRFGTPAPALACLVVLKIFFDVLAHLQERGRFSIRVLSEGTPLTLP